jgi:hypothetical protein
VFLNGVKIFFFEGRGEVVYNIRPGRPTASKSDQKVENVRIWMRIDGSLVVRITVEQLNMNRDCPALFDAEFWDEESLSGEPH